MVVTATTILFTGNTRTKLDYHLVEKRHRLQWINTQSCVKTKLSPLKINELGHLHGPTATPPTSSNSSCNFGQDPTGGTHRHRWFRPSTVGDTGVCRFSSDQASNSLRTQGIPLGWLLGSLGLGALLNLISTIYYMGRSLEYRCSALIKLVKRIDPVKLSTTVMGVPLAWVEEYGTTIDSRLAADRIKSVPYFSLHGGTRSNGILIFFNGDPDRWHKPEEHIITINVDDACPTSTGNSGVGVIAGDHHSLVVTAQAIPIIGPLILSLVEAKAILQDVYMALELDAHHIQIESDAANVIRLLKSPSPTLSPLYYSLQEVRSLLSAHGHLSIHFVRRFVNKAADGLARFALSLQVTSYHAYESPSCVSPERRRDETRQPYGQLRSHVDQTAARPWDPPLIDNSLARAFKAGRILRTLLPFPIHHRVFVSPFLRCVQTASEVVSALCTVDVDASGKETIRVDLAPKDGIFRFDVPQLESMLPSGTLDPCVERVYKELPQWEETVEGCRSRYEQVITALADKYPSENLILVARGKGRSWSFDFGVLGAHDRGRSRVVCVFGIKKIGLEQKRVDCCWEL
ncbi:hypothetical protein F3Y22_tig00016725pilonHSYRG00011 [Hibiscus syriacus]|uniref:RNase H type-1 domain-containing protein n=1 Tax=Hibiscus syriacus TaxID=106335 RepID=A0A6A3BWZ4_HIBSY|nr:hypothetical protein F3Y22_tig00016725pilonHSYRG00011 [Hibiscus syriacus]